MLFRTEKIDSFHLNGSRTEKELFEEFLKTEEPDFSKQMHQYSGQAKGQPGEIKLENRNLCSKVDHQIECWLSEVCANRRVKMEYSALPAKP